MAQRTLRGAQGIRISLDAAIFIALAVIIALCAMRIDLTNADGEVWLRLAPKKIKNPMRILTLALAARWALDRWLDRRMADYWFWTNLQHSRVWHYGVFALLIGLCSLEPATNHIYDRAVALEQFGAALALVNLYELAFLLGSGSRRAFLITLAVFFGTYLMPLGSGYITASSPALGAGFCALYVHFTARWSAQARGKFKWTLLGAMAAAAAWVHSFNLILAPLAILVSIGAARRDAANGIDAHWPLRLKQFFYFCASAAVVFIALRFAGIVPNLNFAELGKSWINIADPQNWFGSMIFDREARPHVWTMLTSLEGGLLFHCPLMAVALLGLWRCWRLDRWMASGLLVFFAAQLALQGALMGWEADGIFRLAVCAPLFVILLNHLADSMRAWPAWPRRGCLALIFACVLWTALAGFQLARNKFVMPGEDPEIPEWRQRVEYRTSGIERYLF
ncbi:hypothetical protein JXA32_16725 [Candidatus Sumerlaeota bacterium]|nr:hypothetical protein [Candidatus Sumerlaeota bacterium]